MVRSALRLAGLLGGLALLGAVALPSLAQDASPPRPSHIHVGDCDELGEVIQPLNSLTVPTGEVLGNSDAVVAEAAFTTIDIPLIELVATDHALKVHLSKDQIQTYLACGDIGGALDADGALIVGLKELDNSGYTGIAYLAPGADGASTDVTVFLAETGGRTRGGAGASASGSSDDTMSTPDAMAGMDMSGDATPAP